MRLFGIFVALVTGLGWQWTRLLEERGWIDNKAQFYIAAGLSLVFLSQQVMLQYKRPVKRAAARERASIAVIVLEHQD